MQIDEVELTVLMPCLNESRTLAVCIAKAQRCLHEMTIQGEVLVADNGSTDGSEAIATDCGARVVSVPLKGYGAASLGGIRAARGKYIIMGDADDSYDFSTLQPFFEQLRSGCDLVIGNRFWGGIAPGAMPRLHRYIGNPILSFVGRLFFRNGIGDFHCGMRGFSKTAAERMQLQTTGMEFASEMVVKATLLRMKIVEVPTTLHPDGRGRPGHLRSWRDGWRHLRFLLMFSPRWLFFYPGLVLMTAGSILVGWLSITPLKIGSVILDIHTLLYAAAMVIVGFQAVLFALFTKRFAIQHGLLPHDAKVERLIRWFTLEIGLAIGLVLVGLGLFGTTLAILDWAEVGFGSLEPQRTMRIVIGSVLALSIGIQACLSSFFLSILCLANESNREP